VRGNGRIVDELEALFAGAGWNVIKLLWGSDWDALFARDAHERCATPSRHRRRRVPDLRGHRRRLQPRALLRPEPERCGAVAGMTDDEIDRLHRGGHDRSRSTPPMHAAASHIAASRP
jgi:pyruvate dehydrogenase E1 component